MCRLFGFRSFVPSRTHRSLIEAENALSRQSTGHPDGWGIGWFVEEEAYIIKSASAAHASERFRRASSRLTSATFVVHVRRATVGAVDHLNAHPFRFGRWLFAHNGTIFGFGEGLRAWMLERVDKSLQPLILGDTDSEHLFYYLLSALTAAGIDRTGRQVSDASKVGGVVREALLSLSEQAVVRNISRPITNILLTDGRVFVAHRAGMPLLLATQKRYCPDFDTCPEPSKVCMEAVRPDAHPVNHILVASEPIGEENIWETVVDGSTLILDEDFMLTRVPPPSGWVAPELPPGFSQPLV